MSNLQKYLNKVNNNVDREIEKFVLKYIKKAWFPEALETNLDMFGTEFEKNFYKDNRKKIDLEYSKEFKKQKKTNRNIQNAIKRGF